jgi:O-antigen/teichoic acid export membrane protein
VSADPIPRAAPLPPSGGPSARLPYSGWVPLQRIGFNSSWLFLARLVTQGQLAFFAIWSARQLGAAGFGQYSFMASVVALGNVLTTFGTDTLLIRDLARSRQGDDRSISTAAALQFALSALFIGFVFLWASLSPGASQAVRSGLEVYVFSLLPLAFFSVFTSILRAWERMDLYLLLCTATALIQAGGALWIVRGAGSLMSMIWFLVGVQAAAAALAGLLCWRAVPRFRLGVAIDLNRLAGLFRLAWPLALLSLVGVVYLRLGVLAVTAFGGDVQTGWFSAASRLVEGFKLLHIAVLGAVLPALSHWTGQPQDAEKLFRTVLLGLAGFSLAAAFGGTLLAGPLVTLLFGAGYSPAVPLFRILVWVLVPYTLTACLSLRLVTRGREKTALAAAAGGLVLAIGLNLWLVPVIGSAGAVSAAVLAESGLAAVYLWLRWKE